MSEKLGSKRLATETIKDRCGGSLNVAVAPDNSIDESAGLLK